MNYQADIQQAVSVLKTGGVILYPTDTVWGLGCDATNAQAIDHIYSIKKRATKQNLLVLAADMRMLQTYVSQIPDVALQLLEYADKPMSIIYPNAVRLPENLIADDASIGIRLPNDPFCCDLIRALGKPVVSTSANISGEPTPTYFAQISDEVKQAVSYIVRWRQNDRQPAAASSIIKVEADNSFRIIRM
ncbi:MAG: threonylcarbamoyl-AMP synthase [Bacteroidales bacterium]|jgi:L-threonylcarbamoyladenylate synthase|nr:threonylcarbamoyl-AMP synthase [Bacteroidales bacterium]